MTEENITDETLTDVEGVATADGGAAVENEQSQSESIKDILSKTLGKDFQSDEAALKAVKDTFSYVGKKKEDIAREVQPQIDTKNYVSRSEFEEATYYAKHPEYEPYKKVISALRSEGKSFEDVVKSDDFKHLYDKATAYDKVEQSKSVLKTNPRLGKITDNMSKAKDYVAKGEFKSAKSSAVAAVLDAYES